MATTANLCSAGVGRGRKGGELSVPLFRPRAHRCGAGRSRLGGDTQSTLRRHLWFPRLENRETWGTRHPSVVMVQMWGTRALTTLLPTPGLQHLGFVHGADGEAFH